MTVSSCGALRMNGRRARTEIVKEEDGGGVSPPLKGRGQPIIGQLPYV